MHKHKAISIFAVKIPSPRTVFSWRCLTSLYFLGRKKLFYFSSIQKKLNKNLGKTLNSVQLSPVSVVFLLVLIFFTLHPQSRTEVLVLEAGGPVCEGFGKSLKLIIIWFPALSLQSTFILCMDKTVQVPTSVLMLVSGK